ncbi:hypothetical protein [Pseudomonas sp. 008]|uniref:hypothetical protein n=1 Tax=Pseudomonas sp. 008 TaxID=2803906 RepID=UPI00194F1FBD|nr:hypothetical protein [Pseudomonas sp. 008]GID09102.1 hypothetical protein TMM008_63040 [Pseudomonas sp. 008]
MTTPESIDDGILALSPPDVLGATPSVVGAHRGVSLLIYDLVIDGKGATVEVDPPLSGTVDPGDVIWLWLLGETAFLDSKIITDVNAKTILRIPKGRLHPDRINELFYTITRNSSNIGKSEPNLTLLYNKIRPGLKDRFPEIDGHSELALLLPDAIKHGVGPDFVSAQVCVSYPYCRAYDTITLKCNGEIMTYKVGANEAPQPPNPGSADPITVCFTVTRAYLESAVRPDGKLDFSCTCTDQLGNTPDTDAVWSATQRVDEDLAGTRLPAPILLERMGDYPGDDPTRIERDKLDGGPLFVIVATTDNRFLPGDIIEATYTAKVPGQPEDLVVLVNGVVETDPFGQKKPCILQVPNDKVIAESAVTVVYTLKRGGTVIASSATAKAQVIAERTITLNPPVPAANPVDPLAHSQGVEVEVAFAGSLPKDQALLVAVNALPGSLPFSMLPLDPDHRAVFTLDAAFLGLWHGKQPQLRWDLIRNGEVIAQSSALVLTVNRIAHEDPRLTRPVIVGHPEQILEVAKLLATDKLSIAQWLLQTQYIPVWLRFDGILANGQSDFRIIWSGQIHRFEPSDLVISLTAALVNWLKSLKDGSEVTITFAVNFDKVVDEAKAVRFPVRAYTVKAIAPFFLDTTPINLDGLNVSIAGTEIDWELTGKDPVGTAATREPTGGYPPYTYRSSHPQFVSVDSMGSARSEGNGTATIYVSDAKETKSYKVTASNVTGILYNPDLLDLNQAKQWVDMHGSPITPSANIPPLSIIATKYVIPLPANSRRVYFIGVRPGHSSGAYAGYFNDVQPIRWVAGHDTVGGRTYPVICLPRL